MTVYISERLPIGVYDLEARRYGLNGPWGREAPQFGNQSARWELDKAREFHVASVPRRSQRRGWRECHCRGCNRNHDKARPKLVMAAMAKVLGRRPDRESSFRGRYIYMRRTLYLLLANFLLFGGLTFSVFAIVQAQGLRPFVLLNALIMVAAGGVWLLDEFVRR
jgi:hypothetical protein